MKVIHASPNGSCLFISLRLGLEYTAVLKLRDSGQPISSTCLNGFDRRIVESAENLRTLIVKWYDTGLEKEMSGYGCYVEAADSRKFVRGDLLAMEMVNTGHDVAEEGPERLAEMTAYLRTMKMPRTWGGAPEFTAFAFMSKLRVEVYQPITRLYSLEESRERVKKARADPLTAESPLAAGLLCINTIEPPDCMGKVQLLYNGSTHYDLLLEDSVAEVLEKAWPAARIVPFQMHV